MAITFFNTLTRQPEPFVPLDPDGRRVGMYCCGPTVHDYAHIGNFRTFVFVDLLRRHLEHRGFEVRHVMNITDVEDKIIRRVRESGATLDDHTTQYTKAFLQDLKLLGCRMPQDIPRATDHIGDIIGLIRKLEQRGIAYKAQDGSVYFSIQKYQETGSKYGRLLNLNFDGMRQGDRVRSDEYEKESVADFALWKSRVEEDGGVFWTSPWGEGRPGWHIECSAMSMKMLGPSFDLHLGGEDLIFPHHEDEIAQSEGAGIQKNGERFVQCWMHGAHLLVQGKKMSKSLGNYFTLRDLVEKGYSGREIRYLLMTAHYREQFNFTLEGLDGARSALGRLDECLTKLRDLAGNTAPTGDPDPVADDFSKALDDDLNVSRAWAVVFDWIRESNRLLAGNQFTPDNAASALRTWDGMNEVLGVGGGGTEATVPPDVLKLAEARQEARKAKDFQKADELRNKLQELGWIIEDTPKGPKVKRLR